jgi:MFS family permease
LIIAGGNFLFTIVSLFLLDSVGRRPVLILSLVFQCLALAIFALASTFTFESQTFLFVCCLLLYFFGFAIGLGPVTWLIISEIYPSAIRGKAIGITVMINNIMAFTVAGFFLSVLHKVGAANTFWIFSIIAFSGLLFVLWFIPETRQKSLDEIEMQFRKKN